MAPTKPAGVPAANWLPTRRGLFSVLLRIYGPTGNTARLHLHPARDHARRLTARRASGGIPVPGVILPRRWPACPGRGPGRVGAGRPPPAPRRQSFAAPTPLQVITDTYAET
jgi:hypothetical protein